jgi:DNA-binding CsgD family transcriptional regulator
MENVKKLVEIWKQIPSQNTEELEINNQDIIKKYIDVFHIGEYFYLIFNTTTAKAEFVSPQIFPMMGIQPEEFSLELFLNCMHPEDFPYYHHYEKSAVEFFTNLPQEHFFNYKFSYDFRLTTKNGETKRFLQQVVPIYYFPEGGARTLGIFTDITHLGITGIPKLSFIGMNGSPSYYNHHLTTDFKKADKVFTKRELEILDFVIQGMKSEDIAKKLNLSLYTIQTHRKNILKKSGCKNLHQLISTSIREGWI